MDKLDFGSRARATIGAIVTAAAVFGAAPTAAQVVRFEQLQERGKVVRPPIMPARFRGHWSEVQRACSADAVGESQVWITGRSLNAYKTVGQFTRIVAEAPRRTVVTVRTEGEGTVFVSKKGLTLSPDGRSLTIRDEDDTGNRRFYRCPAKTASR
jgi:hypothetical protein